jgi:hypothetical protein
MDEKYTTKRSARACEESKHLHSRYIRMKQEKVGIDTWKAWPVEEKRNTQTGVGL